MTVRAWSGALFRYDLFAFMVLPLAPLVVALRFLKRRKGLVGFREKLSGNGRPVPTGTVLVHGVSLGEVGLMGLLVRELQQRWACTCTLTTTTETGWAALEQRWAENPRAFLPLDLPWAVDRFLTRTQPTALVLLELELWPRLLMACHQRGIPVYLVNARVGDSSFRGYSRFRRFIAPLLRPLHLAVAQNTLWGSRLRALGCERVAVSGSLKADLVVVATAEQTADLSAKLQLDDQRPVLLVASTSAGEEAACIAAWQQVCPHWQLVICPRHPERGAAVQKSCAPHATWRWQDTAAPTSDSVRIVDTIGQLAAAYALADIAIVGGSLGSGRHGQNMLEAAAAGCCTVVGRDTSNFKDAMDMLRAASAVIESDPAELAAALRPVVDDTNRRMAYGANAQQAWLQMRGAKQRCLEFLQQAPPSNQGTL